MHLIFMAQSPFHAQARLDMLYNTYTTYLKSKNNQISGYIKHTVSDGQTSSHLMCSAAAPSLQVLREENRK